MADIDERTPPRPDAGEIAAVGSSIGFHLAPYIGEISPDPRRASAYRQGWRDDSYVLLLYRDTLRDEQAYSTFSQRLDAAIAVDWDIRPGGEGPNDEAAAGDLKAQIKALDFDSVCRQMLHGVWYGYAVAEPIWKPERRRIALGEIRVRAPDRFRWEGDRDLRLRTWDNPMGEKVPPAKFWVLARPGEHGDVPHGPGLARWCYWPAWMRRNGHRFWAVALEKFGAPTPKGHYPRDDEASKARLLEVLRSFATGAGVALPEGQDIELLVAAQRAGGDFEKFAEYMDKMIAKTILGQSATTEQGPWRGTAEVQKDVRDEVIAADCRLLVESFNSTIAAWLTHWNFPGAAVPIMVRDASPPEDLDARAKREETVGRMAGLRPTQAHVESVYGGEWEAAPGPAAGMQPPPDADPATMAAFAAFASGRSDDAIGRAAAQLVRDEWEPMMEPVIEPILAAAGGALARGDSLEAFRDNLPELFAAMDDSRLVETLHRMGFTAALSGEAGLDDG